MDPARKLKMFNTLVAMGYKEIEVGFPSASQTDFDFVRQLIEDDLIPDDVTIQVLTQCREDLIRRTYESIRGRPRGHRALLQLHLHLQRKVVFGLDKDGITEIAVNAAKLCRKLEEEIPDTLVRYEYSPESYTGTEVEYAVEICDAVAEVIEPTPEKKLIMNLPATVEMYTPNLYADTIEWFLRTHEEPQSITLVAAPAQRPRHRHRRRRAGRAGRRRPRGGLPVRQRRAHRQRRPGHPGPQPVQPTASIPQLDISDIDAIRRVAEYCNRLPVPNATRGRATWCTRRSAAATRTPSRRASTPSTPRPPANGGDYPVWGVPYLPLDPKHLGPHLRGRHPGEQPERQGRRGLRDEDRARLRPAPPPADRVLQDHPAHHRGHRHRDQPGGHVGRLLRGVGLGLGDVDPVAAQVRRDLLLLEREGGGARHRVEAAVEHGPRRLGDDAHPLGGVHRPVPGRVAVRSRLTPAP
jgi:2-isopropylmalate synthase